MSRSYRQHDAPGRRAKRGPRKPLDTERAIRKSSRNKERAALRREKP